VHVAVGDATRLSYVEMLPDERGPTTVTVPSRAVAWFNGQGYRYAEAKGYKCRRVLSDNGSAYNSHDRQKSRPGQGIKGEEDQAVHPKDQRQGQAVWPQADFVYIKTLLEEWAYEMHYSNSAARHELLAAYLRIHNGRRCHMPSQASPPNSGSPSCRYEQPGGKAHLGTAW
jgi:hypothetical protein